MGNGSPEFVIADLVVTSSFWVRVTNAFGSANSAAATVTVNLPPTLSAFDDLTINEDTPTQAIPFTISDSLTAPAALSLSAISSNPSLVAPGNIVFGGTGSNRHVFITPAANQNGTAIITLTVSDGSLTASDAFSLTVTPVNDAPTIGTITDQSTDRSTATPTIAFVVGDIDNDPGALTLSGSSSAPSLIADSGIVFTGSGTDRGVTLTPLANQLGTATITVTVSDGARSTSRIFTLTLLLPKPVITSPSTASGRQNDPFQYLITATDAPSSFAVSGLPGGLTLTSSTGLISGTPTTHGTFSVTLSATNTGGTGQRAITLTIAPPIPPPVVLNPKVMAGIVNVPLSFQADATNTPAAYELLNAPLWLSVDAAGLITGTPTTSGVFNFKIRASNNSGFGAYANVSFTVEPNPLAPAITSLVEVRGRKAVPFDHAAPRGSGGDDFRAGLRDAAGRTEFHASYRNHLRHADRRRHRQSLVHRHKCPMERAARPRCASSLIRRSKSR